MNSRLISALLTALCIPQTAIIFIIIASIKAFICITNFKCRSPVERWQDGCGNKSSFRDCKTGTNRALSKLSDNSCSFTTNSSMATWDLVRCLLCCRVDLYKVSLLNMREFKPGNFGKTRKPIMFFSWYSSGDSLILFFSRLKGFTQFRAQLLQ